MNAAAQNRLIVDQFTRQAEPFARMPAHSDSDAIRLVAEAVGVGPQDTILDVACGPGILACALARIAQRVTGIDLTPAMIEQAQALQRTEGLVNLDWQVGDVAKLPFDDGSFSVVVSRYSFHHLLDPATVLGEMVRVTTPGGRVAVVDVYMSSHDQAEAYDHVEKLRDPSHVRALGLDELHRLFDQSGCRNVTTVKYPLEVELDELLAATRTDAVAAAEVRRIFNDDLLIDRLGVGARRDQDQIRFRFPVAIVVGQKPGV